MSMKIWIVDSTDRLARDCAKDLEIVFPAAFTSNMEAQSFRDLIESDARKLTGLTPVVYLDSIELFMGGFAEALRKVKD